MMELHQEKIVAQFTSKTNSMDDDEPPSFRPRRRRLRLDDDGGDTPTSMTEIDLRKTQWKVPEWNEEEETTTTAGRGCHPATITSCLSTSARTCSTSSSTTITLSEAVDEISVGSACTANATPPLLMTSTTGSNEDNSHHEERVVVDNLGQLFDECGDGSDENYWRATATSTDVLLSAVDPTIPSREEWKQIADGSNGGIIEDLLDVVEGMQEIDLDQEEEVEASEDVDSDEVGSSTMFLSSLVSSLIPKCGAASRQDRTSSIQSQEESARQDTGRTSSSSYCWRLSLPSSSSPPPPLAFQIAPIPVERFDDEEQTAAEHDVEYSMDNHGDDTTTNSSSEEELTSFSIPAGCQIKIADTATITRDEEAIVVVDVTREEWKTFAEERGILRDLILLLSC